MTSRIPTRKMCNTTFNFIAQCIIHKTRRVLAYCKVGRKKDIRACDNHMTKENRRGRQKQERTGRSPPSLTSHLHTRKLTTTQLMNVTSQHFSANNHHLTSTCTSGRIAQAGEEAIPFLTPPAGWLYKPAIVIWPAHHLDLMSQLPGHNILLLWTRLSPDAELGQAQSGLASET